MGNNTATGIKDFAFQTNSGKTLYLEGSMKAAVCEINFLSW